ncbi:MAG: hypothetical protein ACM3JG_03000 [Thiohalocapsa sp.]
MFLRATYRYFGTRTAAADGLFFRDPSAPQLLSPSFPQRMTVTAHGVFLGAGLASDLAADWFIDASLEIGAASLRSHGVRDVGTLIEEPFPARRRFNLAYGAGASLGRRLTPSLALVLAASWDNLGRADTGLAPDIGGGPNFAPGVRPNASMTATLDAAAITLGLRYRF